jgi:hypothetical protein
VEEVVVIVAVEVLVARPLPAAAVLLQSLLSWVSMLLRKEAASSKGFDNSSLYLIRTRQ